jgi:hypothetical protein
MLKVAAAVIGMAGVGLGIHVLGQIAPPAPMAVSHSISMPDFGVQVVLPGTWTLEAGSSGTRFVAAHSLTGAALTGAVATDDQQGDSEAALDQLIENEGSRSGAAVNAARGVMMLGLLDARWVEFSTPGQDDSGRVKRIALQRKGRTLTFTCRGGASAQQQCLSVIHSLTFAR